MATRTQAISQYEDTLDVREIIARLEDIEDAHEDHTWDDEAGMADCPDQDEHEELDAIRELLNDLAGSGGDEQWNGAWYPITLIRDSYFKDYAMELAEEIGALKEHDWPYASIDWDRAARELQMDYSPVEFLGITFWYR